MYMPEFKVGSLESENQPSALHLGPTPRSLGGGPGPSVSSPEDVDELQ